MYWWFNICDLYSLDNLYYINWIKSLISYIKCTTTSKIYHLNDNAQQLCMAFSNWLVNNCRVAWRHLIMLMLALYCFQYTGRRAAVTGKTKACGTSACTVCIVQRSAGHELITLGWWQLILLFMTLLSGESQAKT